MHQRKSTSEPYILDRECKNRQVDRPQHKERNHQPYRQWLQASEDGLRDIANIPLKQEDGVVVRVGDIAKVEFGGRIRQGAVTMTRRTADGTSEPLAEVVVESGPPQIRRDDVKLRVVIQSNVEGRDMGGLVGELRQRIAEEIKLPAGYSIVFGGQFENQERAQQRLMIVVPLSLGLIFLLLYFTFHSVEQAVLIMLNVPLALIGDIAALYWTGQYLSVPGSIGFIAPFGLAVLNGVVMVNAINQNKDAGLSTAEAVFPGALSRLRPVIMTAAIAALGLIPMLFSTGIGSEVQRPLATVVVGGLASSTLLTLFVLPALYRVFSSGVQSNSSCLVAKEPLICT